MNYPIGLIKSTCSENTILFDPLKIVIPKRGSITMASGDEIAYRTEGNFKGKGLFLSPDLDWYIVEDDEGNPVLVAARK